MSAGFEPGSSQSDQLVRLLPQQLLLPGVDQPRKEIDRFGVDEVSAAVVDDVGVDADVDRRFGAVGGGLAESAQDEVDEGSRDRAEPDLKEKTG